MRSIKRSVLPALLAVSLLALAVVPVCASASDAGTAGGSAEFGYCIGVSYGEANVYLTETMAYTALKLTTGTVSDAKITSLGLSDEDARMYASSEWSEYEKVIRDGSGTIPDGHKPSEVSSAGYYRITSDESSVVLTINFTCTVTIDTGIKNDDGTSQYDKSVKSGKYATTVQISGSLLSSYTEDGKLYDYPMSSKTFAIEGDNTKVSLDVEVKGESTASVRIIVLDSVALSTFKNMIQWNYGTKSPADLSVSKWLDVEVYGGEKLINASFLLDKGMYVVFAIPEGYNDSPGTFSVVYSVDGVETSNATGTAVAIAVLAVAVITIGLLITFPIWYKKIIQ
jgi:hypothetical protein